MQENREPSFLTLGYFKAMRYMNFYKKLPFALACIVWGIFCIWGIIDPCVIQTAMNSQTTFYGVMQLDSGFLCWLIWALIGAALAAIVFFAARLRTARLLLQIHYLQIAGEDEDVILDGYYEEDDEEEEDEESEDDESDEDEDEDDEDDEDDEEDDDEEEEDEDDDYIEREHKPSLLDKIKSLFRRKSAVEDEEEAEMDEEAESEEPVAEGENAEASEEEAPVEEKPKKSRKSKKAQAEEAEEPAAAEPESEEAVAATEAEEESAIARMREEIYAEPAAEEAKPEDAE